MYFIERSSGEAGVDCDELFWVGLDESPEPSATRGGEVVGLLVELAGGEEDILKDLGKGEAVALLLTTVAIA